VKVEYWKSKGFLKWQPALVIPSEDMQSMERPGSGVFTKDPERVKYLIEVRDISADFIWKLIKAETSGF